MSRLLLNRRQYLELEKVALGVFAPITGFMTEAEFHSVVNDLRLPDGQPFPLPIVLDLEASQARALSHRSRVELFVGDSRVGELCPESVFDCDKSMVAHRVYGTNDPSHPGVAAFGRMGSHFVGGQVKLFHRPPSELTEWEKTPAETRAWFASLGWKTIVGFQTRNVPHRGHEYLLRLALEECDGLFIQPLVGQKKAGDFTAAAILAGYRTLIHEFLPAGRVALGILSTAMRYAGPREAIFHAIVRRNYGCSHFIVGRDHAGVGGFYEKYAAHELAQQFNGELGIQVLRYAGPYYCSRCDGIVTERTCPHAATKPEVTNPISGTEIRRLLGRGERTAPHLIRPEVVGSLAHLPLFINENEIE